MNSDVRLNLENRFSHYINKEDENIIKNLLLNSDTSIEPKKNCIKENINTKVILVDLFTFLIGSLALYIFLSDKQIYGWEWGFFTSIGLILYVSIKILVYVCINLLMNMFLFFNKIRPYFYIKTLQNNFILIIWPVSMFVISRNYFQDSLYIYLSVFNIQSIDVNDILICLLVIGISNIIRHLIVDFLIDIPSYNRFKYDLDNFLKLCHCINTVFGTYKKGDKKIKDNTSLPEKFELPLITLLNSNNNSKKEILESITIVNVTTKKETLLISKILFNFLDSFDSNVGINLQCFLDIIESQDTYKENKPIVEELFNILDKDESGIISYDEFLNTFEDLYNSYYKLSNGLITKKTVSKALEIVILFCYIVILTFTCLSILKIDVISLYSSFATILALSSFGLSTSITRFVESVLYITIYREYEIGDMVRINNIIYNVHKIKLFNTIFTAESGEIVFISNNVLIGLVVQNLSKSTNAFFKFELKTNKITTLNQLKNIINKISIYLKENSKTLYFNQEFDLQIISVDENIFLTLSLCIKSNLSWKQYQKVMKSKTHFSIFIQACLDSE